MTRISPATEYPGKCHDVGNLNHIPIPKPVKNNPIKIACVHARLLRLFKSPARKRSQIATRQSSTTLSTQFTKTEFEKLVLISPVLDAIKILLMLRPRASAAANSSAETSKARRLRSRFDLNSENLQANIVNLCLSRRR